MRFSRSTLLVPPVLAAAAALAGRREAAVAVLAGWLIALVYLFLLRRFVGTVGGTRPRGTGRLILAAFLLFLVEHFLSRTAFWAATGTFFVTQALQFAAVYHRLRKG